MPTVPFLMCGAITFFNANYYAQRVIGDYYIRKAQDHAKRGVDRGQIAPRPAHDRCKKQPRVIFQRRVRLPVEPRTLMDHSSGPLVRLQIPPFISAVVLCHISSVKF